MPPMSHLVYHGILPYALIADLRNSAREDTHPMVSQNPEIGEEMNGLKEESILVLFFWLTTIIKKKAIKRFFHMLFFWVFGFFWFFSTHNTINTQHEGRAQKLLH
jgi:hypothetical protein